MRKVLIGVLAAAMLSGCAASMRDYGANKPPVTAAYDRFRDESVVETKPMKIGSEMYLRIFSASRGEQLVTPQTVRIQILSSSREWKYLKAHTVTFLVDGERVPLQRTRHDGSVERGYVIESISGYLPFDTVRKMAAASSAEGQILYTEFTLSDDHKQTLHEFCSALLPKD